MLAAGRDGDWVPVPETNIGTIEVEEESAFLKALSLHDPVGTRLRGRDLYSVVRQVAMRAGLW